VTPRMPDIKALEWNPSPIRIVSDSAATPAFADIDVVVARCKTTADVPA